MKDETAPVKDSELHWVLATASPYGLCDQSTELGKQDYK